MFVFSVITIIMLTMWSMYQSTATYLNRESSLNIERKYCYWLMAMLVAVASFHEPEAYSDMLDYIEEYSLLKNMNYSQILDRWNDYIGYYGLCKVFVTLHIPLRCWLAFAQFIYILAIWKIVDKFSNDKILSLFLYVSMGLFAFSLQGMKQTMGHTFMLYAFYFLTERKYYATIACAVYAYFCHASVMMFMPALLLCYFKDSKYLPLMIAGVVFMFLSLTSEYLTILVGYSDRDRYLNYLEADNVYAATTYIFFVVMLIMATIGLYKELKGNDGLNRLFYGLSIVTIALQFFATSHSFFFRLALLYQPFFYVCLSNAFTKNNGRRTFTFLQLLTIAMVAFYFLYSNRLAEFTINPFIDYD